MAGGGGGGQEKWYQSHVNCANTINGTVMTEKTNSYPPHFKPKAKSADFNLSRPREASSYIKQDELQQFYLNRF